MHPFICLLSIYISLFIDCLFAAFCSHLHWVLFSLQMPKYPLLTKKMSSLCFQIFVCLFPWTEGSVLLASQGCAKTGWDNGICESVFYWCKALRCIYFYYYYHFVHILKAGESGGKSTPFGIWRKHLRSWLLPLLAEVDRADEWPDFTASLFLCLQPCNPQSPPPASGLSRVTWFACAALASSKPGLEKVLPHFCFLCRFCAIAVKT